MTKPILWLGPIEELDADFDPLLGRSAAEPVVQPKSASTKPKFDPSRSIFDDPLDSSLSAVSAKTTPATQLEGLDQQRTLADREQSQVIMSDMTDIASRATPDIDAEQSSDELRSKASDKTDFSYNNDPIPAGYYTGPAPTPQVTDDPATDPVAAPNGSSASGANKKSFFATLFSKREIPPKSEPRSASINEIWAKSTPVQIPETFATTSTETTAQPDTTLKPVPEPTLGTEPILAATPQVGRNIWSEIDKTFDADPFIETSGFESESEIEVLPSVAHAQNEVGNDSLTRDNPDVVTQNHVTLSPDLELSSDPVGGPPDVAFTAAAEEETTSRSASEPEQVQNPEPEPEPETTQELPPQPKPTLTPVVAPMPDFRNAFNASKFWSLPKAAAITPQPVDQDNVPEQSVLTEASQESVDVVQPINIDAQEPKSDATPIEPLDTALEKTRVLENVPAVEPTLNFAETSIDPELLIKPNRASPATKPPMAARNRGKKKTKKHYVGAFFGTFVFGVAALMTFVSSFEAFGYPFDMVSSYRWYWVFLSVVSAAIWGLTRGWRMVIASFVVMAANLFVTMPASGIAPTGGNTATAVVGWANVGNNDSAMARIFKDADKKKATLIMVAEAPASVLTPPAGWTLIEAPVAGDPTAIAVLSKLNWRAVTMPGEPTMARPTAGDLTIIGVHPPDAQKGQRRTPMRDALINRAGTRAGIQEGPTVVLGDFNAAPWDFAMNQFRDYGNVTRVRCGGWAGATFIKGFGIFAVATDHAFVRDVTVTHCQLGNPLKGSNHKPIWLYIAPQAAVSVTTESEIAR